MLFPKKNLIKPVTSSDWTLSPFATALAPYHLKVNQPTQYQASLFNKLDLKPNTLYTLSCDGISDNAQFYVKRMLNGAAGYHILKKGIEVLEFTAVAGATYTIEFHNGTVIGEGYVLNFQLEEGKKTPFEPYKLANAPAFFPTKNLFNGIVESGSFDTVGNIGDNSINVRGIQYVKIVGGKTYTFSVLGKTNISPRIYWYDSNKNFISSALGSTQTAPANAVFLRWHSGSVSLQDKFQIEEGSVATPYEAYRDKVRNATLIPEKNYIIPFTDWVQDAANVNITFAERTARKVRMTLNNTAAYAGLNMAMPLSHFKDLIGKYVTFSAKSYRAVSGTNAHQIQLRFYGGPSGNTDFVLYGSGNPTVTKRIPEDVTNVFLRIQNNAAGSVELEVEDLQLEEGMARTDYNLFKLNKNKPLSFYPRKNLVPDFKDPRWFSDYSTGGGTMVIDPNDPYKMKLTMTASAQGKLIWIPVEVGKTYTFSFGKMDGLYRLYKRKVGNHDVAMVLVQNGGAGAPATYTFTPDADYQGFVTIRLTQGMAGTFSFEDLKVEEGPDKTPRQDYKNNMKPAILYPQKNLIPPLTDSAWKPYATTTVKGPYSLLLNSTAAWNTSYCVVPVEIGKTYTHSCKIGGEGRMEMWMDGANRSTVDGVTSSRTFTAITNTVEVRFVNRNQLVGTMTFDDFQLEEGPVATKFEPLKLGNKK